MKHDNFNAPNPDTEAKTLSNRDFLAEVFRGIDTEMETAWTAFFSVPVENAGNKEWKGAPVRIESVPDSDNCNAYFSPSTVSVHKQRRLKNTLQKSYCIVFDDADGAIDLEPSWVLQTSANSHQVGYLFTEPVTDINLYDQALRNIKKMGTADKSGNGAVRYVRLPRGINNKLEYDAVFPCQLLRWNPTRRYTFDQIRQAIEAKIPARADSDGVVIPSQDRFAKSSGTGNADLITTIITAGEGLHDAITQFAWRKVKDGVNPGEIKNELRSYMNKLAPELRDERWMSRFNEIDRAVQSAIEKVGQIHQEETKPLLAVAKVFNATSPVSKRDFIEINGCKSYSRGFLTVTGAAGGTGKSSLAIVEELSVVLGVDLFHPERKPIKGGPRAVWSMSLEDDEEEHRRRVLAAMYHYAIKPSDLGDRYLVTYKADSPIKVVTLQGGKEAVNAPQVEHIMDIIREHEIALLNVDPFVNTHEVSENDNGAMNTVADAWRSIAQETKCAVGLTHHLRKGGGLSETNAEDLRGAVSLHSAARIVRILKNPSEDEAVQTLGVDPGERKFYFWVDPTSKSNIAPPAKHRVWYRMWGVDLMNGEDGGPGDNVGVATPFSLPDSLEGVTRYHVEELARKLVSADDDFLLDHCRKGAQAKDRWIGFLVGRIVGLDPDDVVELSKIKRIISKWTRDGVLVEDAIKDSTRQSRPCFRIGKAAIIEANDP